MENKLQYYVRVFKGASFEKFFKVLDNAHTRSGKNKVVLFCNIFKNAVITLHFVICVCVLFVL